MTRRRRLRHAYGAEGDLLIDGPDGARPTSSGAEEARDEPSAPPTPPPAQIEIGAEPVRAPVPRRPADAAREERLSRAAAFGVAGRLDEAVALYHLVLAGKPGDLRARVELGVLYDRFGRHELAVDQLRAAQQIDPENPEILTHLGAALGGVGRFEESEREVRRAIRLAPDSLEARAGLGLLFFRKGLYEQADQELRSVCLRDGAHAMAHFYRGEALSRLGDYDEAIRTLERAVELQPENSRVYYLLGILFDRKHLPDRAAAMYRRARETNDR